MTKKIIIALVIIAFVGMAYYFSQPVEVVNVGYGVESTLAISTTKAVGTEENIKIFDSYPCGSRVISTGGQFIRFSLGELSPYTIASTTVSATIGFIQPASTTVVYDAALYGCGEWWAYGDTASTTISVAQY